MFPKPDTGDTSPKKDYLRKKLCDNKLGLGNNLRAPSSPLEIQNLQSMIESYIIHQLNNLFNLV